MRGARFLFTLGIMLLMCGTRAATEEAGFIGSYRSTEQMLEDVPKQLKQFDEFVEFELLPEKRKGKETKTDPTIRRWRAKFRGNEREVQFVLYFWRVLSSDKDWYDYYYDAENTSVVFLGSWRTARLSSRAGALFFSAKICASMNLQKGEWRSQCGAKSHASSVHSK